MTQLTPEVYRHPADRAATEILRRIPYFDALVRRLVDLGFTRRERDRQLGSGVQLGPKQLQRVWERHLRAAETLGVSPIPELYLSEGPEINAYTIGGDRHIVVLNTGLVEAFDDGSVGAVLGHEVGHIHCGHVVYRQMLTFLVRVGSVQLNPVLAGLPLLGLLHALQYYDRATELSCDRAAGIVSGDPTTVCRMLMGLAGGRLVNELDLGAFVEQGRAYREPDDRLDRLRRFIDRAGGTHPLTVVRVGEFMRWVDEGHLARILGGDYAYVETDVSPSLTPPAAHPAGPPEARSWPRMQRNSRGSEFDQLARSYVSELEGELEEELEEASGMGLAEMNQRIERWLEEGRS